MDVQSAKKRTAETDKSGKKRKDENNSKIDDAEDFEDVEDEEEEVFVEDDDEEVVEDDEEIEITENMDELTINALELKEKQKLVSALEEEESYEKPKGQTGSVFRPGIDKLGEDEVLDYDPNAYVMFHPLTTEWPSLSFDIIPDRLGAQRNRFPHTMYLVNGSQADEVNKNKLSLWKISNLIKTQFDEEEEDNDEDEADEDPVLEERHIRHPGTVNRVRLMPGSDVDTHIYCASWSDQGAVYIWDLKDHVKALDKPPTAALQSNHVAKLTAHKEEGFALSWSTTKPGRLLSGDCANGIYLTELKDNTVFRQDTTPFVGHKASVEDLQWSPTELEVFASCSVDKTVRIWDTRVKKQSARSFEAADCDVNVISWSKHVTYLLASGADDGSFRIWDLRSLKGNNKCDSVAHFKWHGDQITSIEWDPFDESVLCASGADGQVSIWDLSVENDTETADSDVADIPPQLLFSHQGQKETKEAHFHPQIPGALVSCAEDGFNIWKPDIEEGVEQKS